MNAGIHSRLSDCLESIYHKFAYKPFSYNCIIQPFNFSSTSQSFVGFEKNFAPWVQFYKLHMIFLENDKTKKAEGG